MATPGSFQSVGAPASWCKLLRNTLPDLGFRGSGLGFQEQRLSLACSGLGGFRALWLGFCLRDDLGALFLLACGRASGL